MSDTRDFSMRIGGVKLIVSVEVPDPRAPGNRPRRVCVRVSGPSEEIDKILKAEVLSEIDHRLASGKLPARTLEDDIPFGHNEPAELSVELAEVGGIPLPVVTVRPRGVEALFSPTLAEVNARRGYDGGGAA